MPNKNLSELKEYAALQTHYKAIAPLHMRDMFTKDAKRFDKFHLNVDGLLFDYSKHRINEETIKHLIALARVADIEGQRDQMFSGAPINVTEKRPVLHTAQRGSVDKNLTVDGENVSEFINGALNKMKAFSDKIRKEKKITDVVNLGIGGSDLGTRTVYEALAPWCDGPRVHFLPNIDGVAINLLFSRLNPETTMIAVVSKSFTTLETTLNANTARKWLNKHLGEKRANEHFFAVTENIKEAQKAGITEDRIFPMRKWVGGRYSIWGTVGLPIMIAIGPENFQRFLDGARTMDTHFREAPLEKNIPVIMGLLGVWYRNFFNFPSHAVIAYSQGLRTFHAYLQQLDMESNGKSVSRNGDKLEYASGPVIFGEPGTNAQHAFFQSMHQGTDVVPCDIVIAVNAEHDLEQHHIPLNANALAQAQGLMQGKDTAEPHRKYPGNRPNSMIVLERFDPFHLGMLLALYEHKVFVQGLIWNINSFDQWGVELGKTLSLEITQALESTAENDTLDSSTRGLVRHLKAHARP
jgi:glucose-6-phosphate isomerase